MRAFAKVNLFLLVGDRTASGLHEIASLACPVSLYDEVHVVRQSTAGISLSCEISKPVLDNLRLSVAKEVFDSIERQVNSNDNLAARAAALFLDRLGVSAGIAIRIKKNIPFGAGLGGGSSNAAAVLLQLNALFDYPFDFLKLYELGLLLGSDVPQALARGPVYFSGVGEIVYPLKDEQKLLSNFLERYVLRLVKPPVFGDTATAYRRLAEQREQVAPKPFNERRGIIACNWGLVLAAGDAVVVGAPTAPYQRDLYVNDFAQNELDKSKQLSGIKLMLERGGAEAVFLSGSGSTLVGIYCREDFQKVAASDTLRALPQGTIVEDVHFISAVSN